MINIIIVIFLFIGSLLNASEIAILTLNTSKEKEKNNKKSLIMLTLIDASTRLQITIQFSFIFVSLLGCFLFVYEFYVGLSTWFLHMNPSISREIVEAMIVFMLALIIVIVVLVFGILLPKRYALKHAESFAYRMVYPVYFLFVILKPLVVLIRALAHGLYRLFGLSTQDVASEITEEEIRLMVATGSEEGKIDDAEKEMIDNIFAFNDTTVADVMTHRIDVEALEINSSYREILDYFVKTQFTRIPVYDKTLDDVVGILNAKDILRLIATDEEVTSFSLQSMLRKPVFVPDSKRIDKLFYELKIQKTHIAIVIDEYGGTAGIVTMEDLIEEIVGEVFDEYDVVSIGFRKIGEDMYLMDGSIELEKVEEQLQIQLPTDEFDTLNGFLISQIGSLPNVDAFEEVIYQGYLFSTTIVDEKVIQEVKVEKIKN